MINHKSYTDRLKKEENKGLFSVGSMQWSRHDPGNKSTILPWVSCHSAVGNDQRRWGHFNKVTILELKKKKKQQQFKSGKAKQVLKQVAHKTNSQR